METLIQMLERRQVLTTDPNEATHCCGLERDADGFCTYRPHHPVYWQPITAREDPDFVMP